MRFKNVMTLMRARSVAMSLLAMITIAWGQTHAFTVETQVLSPQIQSNEYFGRSNALYDDTMVVATGNHYAYVYERDASGQWSSVARLTPSDGSAAGEFGFRVDVSGDTVIVSAVTGDNRAGALYVYSKPASGWTDMQETAKLTRSGRQADDLFGFSAAIDGDVIVVTARAVDDRVYVYNRPTGGWTSMTESAVLTIDDITVDDTGLSVHIQGDTIVAGKRTMNVTEGVAYVLLRSGADWVSATGHAAKLLASDAANGDNFGMDVSVDGDTVAVSARYDDVNGQLDAGSAYVFVEPVNGWAGTLTQTAKLTASDAAAYDWFGWEIASHNDTVVVSSHQDDLSQNNTGSAYVFSKPATGWADMNETIKLAAASGQTLGEYSKESVSVYGTTVAVGAGKYGTESNNNTGMMFLYNNSTELSIVTQDDADPVDRNTSFSYNLNITNNDASYDATQVTVTDTLPDLVSFVSASNECSHDNSASGGVVTCSLASLSKNGGTAAFEIVVKTGNQPGSVTNQASVYSAEVDTDMSNNSDSETTLIANHAPVAMDDAAELAGNSSVNVSVLVNDSDADGDPLDIVSITPPAHGQVIVNNDIIEYVAETDYAGNDSFTYTIADPYGSQSTATVSLTIINHDPIAVNDLAELELNGFINVYILDNDSDPDSDPLTIVSVTQGTHGQVNLNKNVIKYTPTSNYVGEDSFTYTVSDPYGAVSTATVNVTVKDKKERDRPRGRGRGGSMDGLYLLLMLSVMAFRRKLK